MKFREREVKIQDLFFSGKDSVRSDNKLEKLYCTVRSVLCIYLINFASLPPYGSALLKLVIRLDLLF